MTRERLIRGARHLDIATSPDVALVSAETPLVSNPWCDHARQYHLPDQLGSRSLRETSNWTGLARQGRHRALLTFTTRTTSGSTETRGGSLQTETAKPATCPITVHVVIAGPVSSRARIRLLSMPFP